ncbi:MAG: hypothetical protein J7L53_03370 [Deltaproteobacteria bacterium]|nr:hypothetical protein [Deltaproteobacteria bacterium]
MEQAGRDLVELGELSKRILKSISDDYGISKKLWHTYTNLHWFLEKREGKE